MFEGNEYQHPVFVLDVDASYEDNFRRWFRMHYDESKRDGFKPYTYEEAQEVFMDECLPRYLSELGIVNNAKWCWRAKRY